MPQPVSSISSLDLKLSQASKFSVAQAELAGAASISLIMFNAAQLQQACQQIEVTTVGVLCAKIIAAGGNPS